VTGVEKAGLVLHFIPLLISALEHYEDIVRPTKAFFRWNRDLKNIDDLTTMMDDPKNKLWTEGDIADELRGKLGLVYYPFILRIGEVAEILVEIAKHLNIEGSQQVGNL
ncbi:hypothetical protein K469DRAFT_501671, partial [Zopfia rhizophila CBS 207.26]